VRVYRCLACFVGFAIFTKRANTGPNGVTCPLCQGSEVEEIDIIKEVGAMAARRLWETWKKLPSGD
jgi:hypothetical protein